MHLSNRSAQSEIATVSYDGSREPTMQLRIRAVSVAVCLTLCFIVAVRLRAEPIAFDALYRGVSECRFDLSRFNDIPMEPYSEAVLIALPQAGAVHGFLIDTFYFAPAREGRGEDYGLVFSAPLEAVAQALPELAGRQIINGHLRSLSRLSDETGRHGARGKTLLHCRSGTAT